MKNEVRNQFLIGGLIIMIGVALYFSGITSSQEDECEVVGRQGGNAAGAGIQECNEQVIQESLIIQIILVVGIVLIIRGIMTMRKSSIE
tara:strand:- start:2679 stop:2945 length:267 start_codon:yes stop_codon:yes gene_type:complete